jgi:hypothetical protein
MLSELTEMQESDENVWTCAEVSFTIETRSEKDDEIIEREYTFSNAPEWGKWPFVEFEEKRAEDTREVTARNWRRTKSVKWSDADQPSIDVPPEVSEKLEELLEVDELVLQLP